MDIFEDPAIVAMLESAKDLTIHCSVKNPEEVAKNFELIFAAIAMAVVKSQDNETYKAYVGQHQGTQPKQ